MNSRSLVTWIARCAGIALSLFASLFAFDAPGVTAVLMGLLPAAAVAVVVIAGWRRPWLGAVGFFALAAAYAAGVTSRPDWILAVSGPLVLTGILFAISAVVVRVPRPSAGRGE